MSRKNRELILLLVVVIVLTLLDPFGLGGNDVLTTYIMAPLVYAVPGAFITVLISKLLHDVLLKPKE